MPYKYPSDMKPAPGGILALRVSFQILQKKLDECDWSIIRECCHDRDELDSAHEREVNTEELVGQFVS